MSTRRHKRRRIDTGPDPDSVQYVASSSPLREQIDAADVTSDLEPAPDQEAPSEQIDTEPFAKEQEIWDAFREESYELLEQLPLSLHRAFTLIHELDQQAQEHLSNLTLAILKYVALRRTLAGVTNKQGGPANSETADATPGPDSSEVPPISIPNGKAVNGTADSLHHTATSVPGSAKGRTPPLASKSLATVVKSSCSTRVLLISMAQTVEEISRASVEKQYLAQHVYDLVDRYIRDMDRAIKEQEASISLGLRPGTHPASIMLPEVVVPKPHRNRVVASPPPLDLLPENTTDVEIVVEPPNQEPVLPATAEPPPPSSPPPEVEDEPIDVETTEGVEMIISAEPAPSRGRKKGRRRRKSARPKPEPDTAVEEGAAAVPEGTAEPEAEGMGAENQPLLTLKIPAQVVAAVLPDGEIPDPNEPRYCFCNQVSYGDMIACDNPTCTREWFHMGCVGLTRPPKGKWYCRECIEIVKRPKGKKRIR